MNELEAFKEEIAIVLYGRSLILAISGCSCVKCGKPAVEFRNDCSQEEYYISCFCQDCQDDHFGIEEDEELGTDGETITRRLPTPTGNNREEPCGMI